MKKILLYLAVLFASLQMFSQTVTITESAGWLESAYVKWQPVSGAQSYNVYYSGNGITNQKIDNQLIRSYGTYFRADVLGLAAGNYTVSVKAVIAGVEGDAATTQSLTVLAHDRNGFAFQGGRIPGGYNMDGTPKSNAVIIYVTENTKNTVSLTVTGATTNPCIGLQNILFGFKKGLDNRPLIVRLIGNITDMSVMDGGDIVIENKNNASGSITFEGVGNDAVCNDWGVRLKYASNVEIRNLATMNVNSTAGDDFGMQQDNDHIWVHNNEMFYGNAGSDADQIKGDGALDNKGSTYCTFSYNHFWDSGKCSLLGLSENTTVGLYVTYHHNWFDHSDSRHPRVRFYSAHIYNNYYDGVSKYGAGSTSGSSLFVENNYFRNSKRPMMISMQGTDVWSSSKQANDPGNVGTFSGEDGGIIKAFNNTFDADIATNEMRFVAYGDPNPLYNISGKISSTIDFDAYLATTRGEQIPNTVKSYAGANVYNNFDTDVALYVKNLVPDSPEVAKSKVMQYSGRTGGGDLKWTFSNNVDDTSSSVITALKTAITNYTTSLVAVQGETVVSSQTLTSTSNTNQTVNSGSAIANIVYTWGGDATDATVTGLPASGITFVKDATAKTITISGTPTANVSYSIATTGTVGNPATGSGTITVSTPGTTTGGEVHNFTTSGKTSSFYTITGNMNSTDGSQTYDGLTLTARLKMESATVISYTTTATSTLTLVFDSSFSGKVKLNNVSYTAVAGVVVIPSVAAGTNTILKGDTANLFYIKTVYDTPALITPSISNFTIADKVVGDAAFALTAPTSNSDGTFTYTSSNTAVATVSGNMVTIVGEGTTTITANQAATSIYAAGSISATLKVLPEQVASSVVYDFRDGVIIAAGKSTDNVVTLSGGSYKLHGATYGLNMKVGGQIDIAVTGSCTVRFLGSQYSSLQMEGTASVAGDLGTIATKVAVDRVDTYEFKYIGGARTLRFKLVAPGTDLYLPSLEIIPDNTDVVKADVWDFGAQQLDDVLYNNKLDVATINSWYPVGYVVGTASTTYVMPTSFTAGDLSWVGGSNDRLRSSNTALTRYDSNVGSGAAAGYAGRIYVNGSAQAGRYLSFNLKENDELTVVANTDAAGRLNFVYLTDANVQSDLVETTTTTKEYKFVAKQTGVYKIYDQVNKPSYYRIIRKPATLVAVSGSIDVTNAADIPSGYTVGFTNAAGKIWNAVVANGKYNVTLPAGYTYTLSVGNANGYLITSGDSFEVAVGSNQHNITISKVTLFTVTGNVTGLGTAISNLSLKYTSDPAANKTYVPVAVVNAVTGQYSVKLESGVGYTVSGVGVNEYEILANSVTVSSNTTVDVAFTLKPKYKVTITAPSLDATQLTKLGLKFSNINEAGITYTFTDINNVNLRKGTYSVSALGLDEYPVELAMTSNLVVSNAAVSKELTFKTVTNWSFDDKVIANGTTSYKGMLFTGAVANEIAKGHLNAGTGSTISVPVNPNQKITVTYYYAANFSIQGGAAVTTSSNSTGLFEKVDYVYTGTSPGNVLIAVNGTSYFTDINVDLIVPYTSVITVGIDKDYQTINGALKAISKMVRTAEQRVTVVIDPGNYEEMIVVNSPNVTFKNAAAKPSIALKNKGVDIDANAVRVTSYYGYGYSYYSQGNDNKWNADVLAVNKANNSYTYENVSGTTNGSYWNATAVIAANGFEANDIIFENSFNQYISKKESQDKVVMWTVGNKGQRPTDYGNTAVQNRSFVERAAAIGIPNGVDKTVLKNCRVVGRQDSFYGGVGSRVVVYKGAVMGAVDYIFGGMIGVFYKTDFVMNVSDVAGDASYLTAPQQSSGRGFLLYECKVTSAVPGDETASAFRAKPGYFGRPWSANTSEVVLYKTKIETSNFTGSEGLSLIAPAGWTSSLGGTSDNIYEFGTIEDSGVDNSANRVSWSKMLTTPKLADGTDITTFNFTKGTDGWNPIPNLETIVTLPSDNFAVLVNSATCNGANNGAITVSSKENTLIYDVKINGNSHVLNSENEYTKTLSNLSAGVYEICFSTTSIPGYKQCYEVKIEEPEKIVVSSFVSKNSNTVRLSMQGASQYKVTLNGVEELVTGTNYTAALKTGTNTISVSTDLECQGAFNETIFLSEGIQYFPNPTSGVVQIYLAGVDNEVNVAVFDLAGNLISKYVKSIATNRNFQLELSSYMDGMYLIQLEGKTISKTFKIIKK
ncbi:T9SS type A sorting domain-containing protein [Flavobacterium sp. GSA192]|uniref:pectate lyase family protein n=1 Tax=Flavobacterium sp. GSA192 TaxID=2576304 RepID=UPI00112C6744|nr:T9SS type A sorting domain-containing protein [Flavobacterium sp. GSA192]